MSAEGGAAVAIIAVSRGGVEQARRIRAALPEAALLLPGRFAAEDACGYDGGVGAAVAAAFAQSSALVLVMATGIAVRLLAPLLRDKYSDPAVVVVDDGGRFAISLVGGHLGGANALAERLAAAIGAIPVVTTASEGAGLPALDVVARERGWRLAPGSDLTRVMAALVNGEPVSVVQDCGRRDWPGSAPPDNLRFVVGPEELATSFAAAIVVSCRRAVALPPNVPVALFHPPAVVLGAGSSLGAPPDELIELAEAALAECGRAPESVACVATIERRQAEPALVALAGHFGAELRCFTPAELEAAPGAWQRSEVVRRAVGAGGVAEPAAILASAGGRLLLGKRKSAHATVAVAHLAEDV